MYREAVSWIEGGDPAGWFNLGLAYHLTGDSRRSDWAMRRAASAGDPKGWVMVAQQEWGRRRLAKALRAARRAMSYATNLNDTALDVALEVVLRSECGKPVTEAELRSALPLIPEAAVGVARSMIDRGDVDGAIAFYFDEWRGGNELVGVALGVLLDEHGRTDEAVVAYAEGWEQGEGFAAYNRALLHEERGDDANAVGWARRAADLGDRRARRWLSSHARATRRRHRAHPPAAWLTGRASRP